MSDTGKVWVVDPTDGKPKQVSAEEAQTGFTGGKLQLPVDSEVHMSADDGTTMIFPASKASLALSHGWRFSTAQDVLRDKAQNQQGQAFLEGGLSELTLGGSDAIAQQLGVEGLRERRDTTGGSIGHAVGLGAGLFGPGLIEAAAKAGAKGVALHAAETALAPIRGMQAAGDAVEAAAGKALASSIENETVRRAVASGLGRGVEGAAFGAGGSLSEEALGNPDANAQQLLAGVGSGALLGFGVGGALGAGIRGLGDAKAARTYRAGREAQAGSVGARRYTPEEFQAALETANGEPFSEEAAKGIKGKVYDWYRQAASVAGGNPADIDLVNSKLGQQIQRQGKIELENSGRAMADVMDRMADVQAQSGKLGYGGAKQELLGKLMPRGSEGEVVASAGRALEGVRGVLDDIERDAAHMGLGEGGGKAVVGRFRDAINESEARLMKKAGIAPAYTEQAERRVPNPAYNHIVAPDGMSVPAETRIRQAFADMAEGRATPDISLSELRARFPDLTPEEFQNAIRQLRADDPNFSLRAFKGRQAGIMQPEAESAIREGEQDFHILSSKEAPSLKVTETFERQRGLKDLGGGAYTFKPEFQHEVYNELNHLKQLFDRPAEFGGLIDDNVKRNLQLKFRDAWQGLRNHLEDETVWGQAGGLQRELNQAYASRSAAWEELQNKFKFYESGNKQLKVDRAGVASYVGQMDRMRGDRAFEALDEWQAANGKYADVLDKYFTGQSLGAEARALNKMFSAARQDLSTRVEVFGASRRLIGRAQQQFGFGGNGGVLAGVLLGALGPLGAAGAAIGESILNPGRAALIRANLAGVMQRVSAHMEARVENLVTGAKRAVPSLPTAQRMVSRTTLDMLNHSSPKERRAAYEKRLEEISRLSDPRTFGDHIAQQTLGLSADAPKHADAVTGTAARAMAVLQASIPQARPGSTGDGWNTADAHPIPHDRDIKRFAEVDHALQAPVDALLDHAEAGYVPDHVVRAVEQAYPQVLQSLQTVMALSVGKGKHRVSAARQRVLMSLMQDDASQGAQIRSYQSIHHKAASAPTPPATPKSGSSSKRSASYLTPSDRLDSYPHVQ
jgi:hypothetical protein